MVAAGISSQNTPSILHTACEEREERRLSTRAAKKKKEKTRKRK
jgi:hypothetical protein